MSFGGNFSSARYLQASFVRVYDYPLTLVCWIKKTGAEWVEDDQGRILHFGDDTVDVNNSMTIHCPNTDTLTARCWDNAGASASSANAFTTDKYDDLWIPVIGVFASTTWRRGFIDNADDRGGDSTGSNILTNLVDTLNVGTQLGAGNELNGLIAEVAIFNKALSHLEINQLKIGIDKGIPPNMVAPKHCIGYWPLKNDVVTHHDESGNNGPDLIKVSTLDYVADHPFITPPKPNYILVPLTPAAAVIEQEIGGAIVEGSITFDVDVDHTEIRNIIAGLSINLDATLDMTQLGNSTLLEALSFLVNVDQQQTNTITVSKALSFLVDLAQDQQVQLDKVGALSLLVDLALQQENTKDVVENINLNVETDLISSNTLNALADITFAVIMDMQISSGNIISDSITFLANVDMQPTNNITIERAVDLIINASHQFDVQLDKLALISLLVQVQQAQQVGKDLSDSVIFAATLDQSQTNILNKVAALSLAVAVDQTLETQIDFNAFHTFASTLAMGLATDGDVDVSVAFGVTLNEQRINTKDMVQAVSLATQQNMQTDIHLTASGILTLGVDVTQTQSLQMIGQAGITFGHLLGLASINGADLEADISFGTVQNLTADGFILQFEIVTPAGRTFKVHVEDRTTIVDYGDRTTVIRRP